MRVRLTLDLRLRSSLSLVLCTQRALRCVNLPTRPAMRLASLRFA